jgi:nudix-type nucleoside diphosphatase (YffH/AdpP family)
MMASVSDSHLVFDEKLSVEEATISSGGQHFHKQRVRREDAAAVLLLNTDTNKIILTRQFRYPIYDKTEAPILEIIAGRLDKNEEPLQAALRETREETGYRIRNEHIQLLLSCFSTPGYSSECFYIYYATVTDADKLGEGGGLKEENESIECVELDASEFVRMVKEAKLRDAKTYIAGLYFAHYI